MTIPKKDVLIFGGTVGLACAYYLPESGHGVMIEEQNMRGAKNSDAD